MSVSTLIPVIAGGAVFLLFGWATIGVIRVLLKLRQTSKMAIASTDAASWPEEHAKINAQLQALGFQELGVVVANRIVEGNLDYMRVYVSDDQHIGAKVGYGQELEVWTLFQTYFRNDALLLTRFPASRHIEDTNFHVHHISDSIEAAYDYHRQQLATWQQVQGELQTINSLEDILRQHEIYNNKYYHRELRWIIQFLQMIFVRNLMLVLIGLGVVIASFQESIWLSLAFIVIPMPVVMGLTLRISRRQRAENIVPGHPQ